MAYCRYCGAQIDAAAKECPECGKRVENAASPVNTYSGANDSGSIGWGILGCCIPIVGLILFLVWKDEKPKTAKMAGTGALVSVIIGVIYYIFVFTMGFIAFI